MNSLDEEGRAWRERARQAEAERDRLVEQHQQERDMWLREREAMAAQISSLLDPIVRHKMLDPGPGLIVSADDVRLIAERDRLAARVEELERERHDARVLGLLLEG